MNFKLMFPAKYMENLDLGFSQDRTLKIKRIYPEKLKMEDDSEEKKWLIAFEPVQGHSWTSKSLVISRTVAESCALMFGDDNDKWIGKRLTLYGIDTEKPFAVRINVRGSPDISAPMKKTVQRGEKSIYINVTPTNRGAGKPDAPSQTDAAAEPGSAG